MRISPEDPDWTSPRTGWDWQDEKVSLASAWLAELAKKRTWQKRVAATREHFFAAKDRWIKGEPVPFYDPSDTAAWYLFQADAYGEYVSPEVTTRANGCGGIEETSASYRVGNHSTSEPLPYHMLLTSEDGINHGVHWDPDSQSRLVRPSMKKASDV